MSEITAASVPAGGPRRRLVRRLRRTMPVLVVLVTAIATWAALTYCVTPMLGRPAAIKSTRLPGALPAAATVADSGAAAVQRISAGQVVLTWEFTNKGASVWHVETYRILPVGEQGRIISLPRTVRPGDRVTVQAVVDVPPGHWSPSWRLTGPRGPVEGGLLSARIPGMPPEAGE